MLKDVRTTTIINILFSIAVILGMGIVIIYLLIKRVGRPLSVIEKAMYKMSNFNLAVQEEAGLVAKYRDNKDEVGGLIRSIDALVRNS